MRFATAAVLFGGVLCAAIGVQQAEAGTTPNVSFVQPTSNTGSSPLTVAATVNVDVRELQLYVDGKKYTQQANSSFNSSVTLSNGTHRLAVQAVDSRGEVLAKSVKYVTISAPTSNSGSGSSSSGSSSSSSSGSSGSSSSSSSGSSADSAANQIDNIQEMSSWQTCGTCGNSSGNTAQATYSMNRGLTSPAVDGTSTSAEYQIGGTKPYTNAYWFIEHSPISTPVQTITYDFWLYVPAATGNSPQAIEFECQQKVDGYVYNFAWQADYAQKVWRTFDYVNRAWLPTVIPFAGFTTNTWHHIVAQYHASNNNTVHDSLTVDGVATQVNITRPAKYVGGTAKELTNAFQLDMNGTPTAFSVYVDKMSLSFQ